MDNDGKIPILGILVIAALPFILGGCGNLEEYEIKPIKIETIELTPTLSLMPMDNSLNMQEQVSTISSVQYIKVFAD